MLEKYHLAYICALIVGISALVGQEPAAPLPPPLPVPKDNEQLPPPKTVAPDPTIPTPKMQELLQPRPGVGPASSTKYPSITLKGRVLSKLRPPVVMIDVDGKTYAIGQGVAVVSQNNQIIKIVEITATEVKIQVDGSAVFALN